MARSRGVAVALFIAVLSLLGVPATGATAVPEGPAPGSPDWYAREAANLAITSGEIQREAADPSFAVRLEEQSVANQQDFLLRQATDPDWVSAGNVCERWDGDCAGDPFRYPGTDPFYDTVGQVAPISFYDRDGAAAGSGRRRAPSPAISTRPSCSRTAPWRPRKPSTGGSPRPW